MLSNAGAAAPPPPSAAAAAAAGSVAAADAKLVEAAAKATGGLSNAPPPKSLNRLTNKVAIITGGTDGIGFGVANVFAREGASLVLTGRDATKGEAAAERVRKATGNNNVAFLKADVSSEADNKAMVALAVKLYKRIDILIANAGVMPSAPIETQSQEDWDSLFAINTRGVFLAVKSVVPHFREQKYGKIVCTSSITGPITGMPRMAAYGASKSAINGFVKGAAIELAKHNININAVEPGNIFTPGLAALSEQYIRDTQACIPQGHLGTPEDIGYAMLFLSSDEARFVTGTSLCVDGGQTLPEALEVG